MVLFFSVIAMTGSSGEAGQSNPLVTLFPFILIFLIMWLLIFRPQARKQKQHQMMISSVQKGDKVLTVGGMYGTVVGLKENDTIIVLKIDDNCKIDLLKSSIAQNISAEEKRRTTKK